jgi:hypothetical protein
VVEMAWDELTARVIAKMSDGYALQVGIVLLRYVAGMWIVECGSSISSQYGSGFRLLNCMMK